MLSERSKGQIRSVLLICILVFSIVGCSSAPTPATDQKQASQPAKSSQPKKGGTITMGYQMEPDTLDPQKTSLSAGNFVGGLLGGALLILDPFTFELKPHLAESYTISDNGKTMTFKIRPGVKFHDGTPLTAEVFKQSYERALEPKTASPVTGPDVSSIKSISAPDDSTLIFHLDEPSASLLSNLSYSGYQQPISIEARNKYGNELGRNPVGVGPWKFESWKTGESITLVRNDDYKWAAPFAENQGPVRPDKFVLKFIQDDQTMMAALDSGTIDIATVSPKDAKKYKDHKDFTVLEGMQPVEFFIGMNLENEILQDVRVRKALNLAINKDALIIADLQGEGVPVYGPIPPTMIGYDAAVEQYGYKYNADQARQLLEEAGWKPNAQGIREKDGKTLSLTMLIEDTNPGHQLVQSMFKEIGVELHIQKYESATALEQALKGEFDLFSTDHGSVDPDILHLLLHSSQIGGLNFFRLSDKQLDSLLDKGRTTTDQVLRQQVFADIQKRVVEQAYWIPLYSAKTFVVVSNRIQGVKPNPLATLIIQDMWVNE
ncbi:ABC transporter substrate-binding protein [Brevibacillus porteri]|uniref:ABC transporter substrate-binding protein n=1 Tax=Brevibacillus porteri TaxID=2126350 RepID=A0ABX5FJR1_9BACL|nr:ABC transporter substrate-binding protein [Brevibacillus porteri]MED1801365.1 ABC transporter substrate-binding protein [Brevibacillus porteri]MED2132753.1 ABC transporter substrate-binding protein [Brevibacillus porteri]MED2747736.1 ABC transporter substrate-binding protein [Brevibacillus porteri]MED2817516.1 ABC transporter substrate-binding protein [Brevibacillus porteri]MED2895458.1 ABC transporter substrate-binding protein [Brevibacillus porteri]